MLDKMTKLFIYPVNLSVSEENCQGPKIKCQNSEQIVWATQL